MVEVDGPEGKILQKDVFSNDSTANSAVAGLYASMLQGGYISNGAVTVYEGLSADELNYTGTASAQKEFTLNSISLGNLTNSLYWSRSYYYIYLANSCIEGLNGSKTLTPSLKNQLLGEAKIVRALHYFLLVNLFGPVPLVTTTDYHTNLNKIRSSSDEIYAQMIVDLTDAENLLLPTYFSLGKIRPNKWTAAALLARVYLYNKMWKEAENLSSSVIASGQYNLVGDPSQVFLSNSAESIWQLRPTSKSTAEGGSFLPSGATVKPSYVLTSDLYNSFELGDLRKSKWIKNNVIQGITYYYPYKYTTRSGAPTLIEQYTILRLAEQYLIRAEARAQQNTNMTGAIADLNVIRTRASLPLLNSALTQSQVLDAVVKERRSEFFCEWGHRWFDLKRTSRADAVLSQIKGASWQSTDVFCPIPIIELQNNPALTQNAGY